MPIQDKTILKSIAGSLRPLIISYQKADNEQIKKWYESVIKLGCRHLELFIKPYVSVEASLNGKRNGN